MADPLTAIGAAASCLQLATSAATVATSIVKFYLDTKKVNESVNNLATEVKSLGGACDLVQMEMVTIARGPWSRAYDEDGRLSKVVIDQLDACRTTIRTLEEIVAKVERERPHWLDKPQRQAQLLWSKESIEDFRRRISTHTQALQIVLQVVNIKISHVAPGHANHDLIEKLNTIHIDLKQAVDAKKRDETSAQLISADLVQCAEDAFTSGTTLYQGSISGSVQGGERAANKNRMVVEWASKIASLRLGSDPSESSDIRSRSGTTFTFDGSTAEATDQTSVAGHIVRGDDDADSDIDEDSTDEDAIDMAQAAIREGTRAFDREEWEQAASLFQESLTDFNRLSTRQRNVCDVFELNYKLVVCCYHTNDTPQTKEVLLDFLSQQPTSDTHRRRMCDAGHMLSQLYIKDGSLDLALDACENALKARRRLLGKEDPAYYESLALMSKVFHLKGNKTRSTIYAGRIPATQRVSLLGSDLASVQPADMHSASEHLPSPSVGDLHPETTAIPQSGQSSGDKPVSNLNDQQRLSLQDLVPAQSPPRVPDEPDVVASMSQPNSKEALTRNPSTTDSREYRPPSCADIALRQAIQKDIYKGRLSLGKLEVAIIELKFDIAQNMIKSAAKGYFGDALMLAACFGDVHIASAIIERLAAQDESILQPTSPLRILYFSALSSLDVAYRFRWPAVFQLLVKHKKAKDGWQFKGIFQQHPLEMRPCYDARDIIAMLSLIPTEPPSDLCGVMIALLETHGLLESPVAISIFDYLLSREPDILARIRLRERRKLNLEIPLHSALRWRDSYFVKRLLQEQALEQVQCKNYHERDALWLALQICMGECITKNSLDTHERVHPSRMEVITALLQAGADVKTQAMFWVQRLPMRLKPLVNKWTRRMQSEVNVSAKHMVKAIDDPDLTALFKRYSSTDTA